MNNAYSKIGGARLALIDCDPSCATIGEIAALARELRQRRGMQPDTSAPDLVGDVRKFNARFGLPYAPLQRPRFLPQHLFDFRRKFNEEEGFELERAYREGDLVGAADALVDRVYVDLGTAHFMGLPFEDHWREVQRANMQKEKPTGPDDPRLKRKQARNGGLPNAAAFDIVKPADWKGPDHAAVLRDHLYVHHNGSVL